ncbi:MAG: hypothetical protein K0S68_943, partial [Candidatus Saccharibacteria bacterium]|nr:hypothetical protein [Candidatus Saccharibacteria bacterium]
MARLPSFVMSHVKELESKDAEAVIAVFDATGYYLFASRNHTEAIGYSPEELLTMHLSQVVDPAEHHPAWVLRTISVFYSGPLKFSSRLI